MAIKMEMHRAGIAFKRGINGWHAEIHGTRVFVQNHRRGFKRWTISPPTGGVFAQCYGAGPTMNAAIEEALTTLAKAI